MQELFHKDIYIDDCHILESFYPYEIHTDSTANNNDYTMQADNGYTSAWTFIIPLDNYNSNTINQESLDIKGPTRWIEDKNPPVLNAIDEETYNKYLSSDGSHFAQPGSKWQAQWIKKELKIGI